MFRVVVVPLDGSASAERAIGPALAAAEPLAAPVHLLRVVEYGDRRPAQDYLDGVVDQVKASVPLTAAVETGDPADRIGRRVRGHPENLVVMASTGYGHTGAATGAVAEAVLRTSFGPMLLVGPSCTGARDFRDRDLVIATDGSRHAAAIFGFARQWADAFNMEPWLVAVGDPAVAPPVVAGEVAYDEANAVRSGVAALAGDGHPEPEWTVLHDRHPDRALIRFAEERGAPLLAMSTHGETGLQRLIAGSVTMRVLRHATCPMLVVRPFDRD